MSKPASSSDLWFGIVLTIGVLFLMAYHIGGLGAKLDAICEAIPKCTSPDSPPASPATGEGGST